MVQIPTVVDPDLPEPSRNSRWWCGEYLVAKAPKPTDEYIRRPVGRRQLFVPTAVLVGDSRG